MTHFSRSWTALLAAVADLPDEDFERPSGCKGWLVRDLVCHLVIDAQDVLITLVTPAELPDTDVLLAGTGRRTATAEERAVLGGLAERMPFVLG